MIVKVNATEIEEKNLDLINETFKNVPLSQQEINSIARLAAWETSAVENILSAFLKARCVRDGSLFSLGYDEQEGWEKQYVKEHK